MMGRNNCTCLWKRTEDKEVRAINFDYFWSKVAYDECSRREPPKFFSNQIRHMYLPKSFIISTHDNDHSFILTIGIVPINKFEVCVRLELENSGKYIEMDASEIRKVFHLLNEIIQPDIHFPITFAQPVENDALDVYIKLFDFNIYKLCVKQNDMFITIEDVFELMKYEKVIMFMLKSYEKKSILYGNTVFKLLNLCSQKLYAIRKTQNYFNSNSGEQFILSSNNTDLCKYIDLKEILNELLYSPCDCVSTSFIIETIFHFQNLISSWIGAYYESQLLSEATRIETFRNKWPHKFIDVNTLAREGFYYVGPLDRVQCIFCKIVLEKWEPKDIVTDEHKRYSPFCSSLLNKNKIQLPLVSEIEKTLHEGNNKSNQCNAM